MKDKELKGMIHLEDTLKGEGYKSLGWDPSEKPSDSEEIHSNWNLTFRCMISRSTQTYFYELC